MENIAEWKIFKRAIGISFIEIVNLIELSLSSLVIKITNYG